MLQTHKKSLIIATIGVILFIIAHTLYNYDIIRKNVEDSTFDYFSSKFLSLSSEDTNSPNIFVFKIDKKYLEKSGYLGDDGKINYGYMFPRDLIAEFITRLDKKVEKLDKKPKALFIDYDLSFSSKAYSKESSEEDKKLLEVLKRKRGYQILLPKTLKENYFEKKLASEIKNGAIKFSSVGVYKDDDGYIRRYQPIKNGSVHVALELYKIAGGKADISKFKKIEVVENKIIIKNLKKSSNYISDSYWEKLKFISVSDLSNVVEESLSDSIIMFGADHSESMDIFKSKSGKVAGVALHANTLMTLFFLDGKLKQLHIIPAIFIVFLVSFLANIAVDKISKKYEIEAIGTQFLILVLLLSVVMLGISYLIFILFKLWFNWFIPLVVLQLHKDWEMLSKIFNFHNIGHKDRVKMFLKYGFKK